MALESSQPEWEFTAPPYTLGGREVVQAVRTDADVGLSHDEVRGRQEQFGFNELKQAAGTPLWMKFLAGAYVRVDP